MFPPLIPFQTQHRILVALALGTRDDNDSYIIKENSDFGKGGTKKV